MTNATPDELARSSADLIDNGHFTVAEQLLVPALREHPDEPALLFEFARLNLKRDRPSRAAEFLERAIALAPGRQDYYVTLLGTISKDLVWQRIDVLERGSAVLSDNSAWIRDLAECYALVGKHREAAEQYSRLGRLGGGGPEIAVFEGFELSLCGDSEASEAAYSRAVELDAQRSSNLRAAELGIGVFFQQRGLWKQARHAFLAHLETAGPSPELIFRIGLCYDRAFRWPEAEAYYRWAAWLKEDSSHYWYKLGFALERQHRWLEAADCFRVCVTSKSNKDAHYHAYRAAWCLEQAEEFEIACEYYLRSHPPDQVAKWAATTLPLPGGADYVVDLVPDKISLPSDVVSPAIRPEAPLQPTYWTELAGRALEAGDFVGAAMFYDRALERSDRHRTELYYRRGSALMRAGLFEDAAESFRLSRIFPNPDGMSMKPYYESSPKGRNARYVQFWDTLPLRDDVILYESSHGKQIGSHPLAIFEAIADDPLFASIVHVWAVEDASVPIPQSLLGRDNVVVTVMHEDLYLRYLATAKYLINDSTFLPYFIRRPGQQYLNTWHGTPLKNMGRRDPSAPMAHSNLARNVLHATHVMVPNEHTARMFLDDFDIRGLYEGAVALTGSPRIDRMLTKTPDERRRLRHRLVGDSRRKIVLYAPTWRGTLDDPGVDLAVATDALRTLADLDCEVLFRAHHFVERTVQPAVGSARLVPRDIDTYDLLSIVDVLVTDYSSVLFDFLPSGREIIRHVPDLEAYERERGFCLDFDTLPGTATHTVSQLRAAVKSALSRDHVPDARYVQATQRFAPFEDGKATERVVKFFFDNDNTWTLPADDPGSRVLFRASLIPNGISTSLHNLLASLPPGDIRPAIILEQTAIEANLDRRLEMLQLPSHVQVLGRSGGSVFTIEEQWVVQKFMSQGELLSDEQWRIFWRAFEREFRRVTGGVRFDATIEFDGYPLWWAALVSASPLAGRRVIYQHNQMLGEYLIRFPHLRTMFELYKHRFDAVVSVSEQLMERNRAELAQFGIPADLYYFCNNQIDLDRVKSLSTEPLDADIAGWVTDTDHLFVTIGRLSVEKNQELLIRSFADIADEAPHAKLAIVGSGFLDTQLQHVIDDLGLAGRVRLTGQRQNPFPILRRADTFVLSSLHEGQPMVLLEALSLGVPIVATDLVGVRGLLGGDDPNGLLVPVDRKALANGLRAALNHAVPHRPFNVDEYAESALQQFRSVALGQAMHGAVR